MNRKRKLVKPASLEQNLSKKNGFTNAKSQEDTLTSHTLVSIGLQRSNKEWIQSNEDRQYW